MSVKLENKVAVVTGASKGIGAEIARQLAAAGAAVVVNYASSKSGADRVVADITAAGGRAIAVQGDVSREADITRLFAETQKAFGPADILVNNAGTYSFVPLEQVTAELFHKHFDLNVLGLLLTTKAALAHFGDRGGSVINISSAVSTFTPPTGSVYNATKGAVDVVTKTLAKELGPRKIRVNSVNPGLIVTEGSAQFSGEEGEMTKMIVALAPLGRVGQVDDIAPAVVFLASDDAKYITGELLFASGGLR